MNKIAVFEKVSSDQFIKDFKNHSTNISQDKITEIYNSIELPKRATRGSAGYDFFSPLSFTLNPDESITVPTGIRVNIDDGWLLSIFPRSGLGFKYRLHLNNTVGIIDSDYYYSDNEGHILIKITNGSLERKTIEVPALTAFAQGIFLQYGITEDDCARETRNGGFGSTTKNDTKNWEGL